MARFGRRGARVSRMPPGARLSVTQMQGAEDTGRFQRALAMASSGVGFPPFERDYRYVPGRKYEADMAFLEQRLLVEVQGGIWRRGGGAHSGGKAIERDIEKHQLAVIYRWHMLPVTTDQVTDGTALTIINEALRALGWTGCGIEKPTATPKADTPRSRSTIRKLRRAARGLLGNQTVAKVAIATISKSVRGPSSDS